MFAEIREVLGTYQLFDGILQQDSAINFGDQDLWCFETLSKSSGSEPTDDQNVQNLSEGAKRQPSTESLFRTETGKGFCSVSSSKNLGRLQKEIPGKNLARRHSFPPWKGRDKGRTRRSQDGQTQTALDKNRQRKGTKESGKTEDTSN